MVRTLALAALVTLFGAGAGQAQYRDSAPADEQNQSPQYRSETAPEGYDEELLGSYEDQQYEDNRYDDRGYNRPDVDVGIFATLSDGRWYMTADFGWVWRPYAATSWRPYTNGRWVWTSYGWTWVSYEPFGWATYHYGYWNCDSALGWVWIPGYEWSACRVQWAYYDNYVAWAPMYPPGYACPRPFTTAGFNIWFTIGAHHFCDPYPTRYCVTSYDHVYAHRVAYKSPGRTYVQQYTRTPIRESTVSFKHTRVVRGSNGFDATRSQTVIKSKSTRHAQPYAQNSRPHVQTKQQIKSSSQRKNFVDARALQQRSREPAYTRQYQSREVKRSVSREAMRPRFETRQREVVRSTNRSSQITREVSRSATHGNSKQSRSDVVKMKSGNGRGAGKH